MKVSTEIEINGAEIKVACEVGYSVDPGQKEILYPVDNAQPGHSAHVEEVYLESATIEYGSFKYEIDEYSKQWDIIEEKLNEDDAIKDSIFSYECDKQESEEF